MKAAPSKCVPKKMGQAKEVMELNQVLWLDPRVKVTKFGDREKLQEETLRQSCCPVMA